MNDILIIYNTCCIFPDRGVASVRMTQFLPPNLLALFAPRDPIPFLPPVDKLPHEKKATHNYSGIAQYVHLFEDPVSSFFMLVIFGGCDDSTAVNLALTRDQSGGHSSRDGGRNKRATQGATKEGAL